MARDEDEIALVRPVLAPLEKVLDLGRAIVFVYAEEAEIEAKSRVFEVVDVAAEGGDSGPGGQDQPNVRILLVSVKVVKPAVIERNHVAAEPGLLQRLLFDFGHDGPAGGERLRGRQVWLHGRVDPRGHVLDRLQDV